jgi:cell division septum initiation protein DivIVA
VVKALAVQASNTFGDAQDSMHTQMAALKMETTVVPSGGAQAGASDSSGLQQQMQQGVVAAMRLMHDAAAEEVGAVAAAWQLLLQLSCSSEGCQALTGSKTGTNTALAVPMLVGHLAQACSAASSPKQPEVEQGCASGADTHNSE